MTKRNLPYLISAALFLGATLWLLLIGQEPWCKCGYIKLWYGESMTSETSQHLIDWYTPSHLLHGFIFFAVLWLVARKLAISWRFAIAMGVEAFWEVLENSPLIIERYRAVTISLDYYGDSVVNSMVDMGAMALGFWLALRLPVWASFAIVVGFEVLTIAIIRDGLALNILMLLYPLDAVRVWQGGA